VAAERDVVSEAMARPTFVVLVLLALVPVPQAWAQRAPSRPPTEGVVPGPARPTSAGVLLSSSVIGARVQARDGTDLGEIHQLVIDRRTGYVSHARAAPTPAGERRSWSSGGTSG
jgi:hypothetical protein